MEKVQAELEALKEQRSQQMKITESIVRQRDMYRVLLAQATGVTFPQQGNSNGTHTKGTLMGMSSCGAGKY